MIMSKLHNLVNTIEECNRMCRKYLSPDISNQFFSHFPSVFVTVFACPDFDADRAHMLFMLHVGGLIPLPPFPHCDTLPSPNFFMEAEKTTPQFNGCKSI